MIHVEDEMKDEILLQTLLAQVDLQALDVKAENYSKSLYDINNFLIFYYDSQYSNTEAYL